MSAREQRVPCAFTCHPCGDQMCSGRDQFRVCIYPWGKIQLSFQDIPDVPLCNIIVGILDTKRSLLDRWRTLAICWKLLKTAFFCKSHAMSLPAVFRVLGNVRQLHPKEPGPVPKSTTAVLTALRLSAAEKQGKLTNEHLGQRDH